MARVRGFSLVELLIVVLLLGIIAGIIIPRFVVSGDDAKRRGCAQNTARINQVVEKWHFDKGSYPALDMADIAADPNYFPAGLPKCPVNGANYTLDAASHRVIKHVH